MNKLTGKETEISLLPQAPTVNKSRGHGLLPTCNSIWIQHIINTHWSPRTESFEFPVTALEWIGVGIKPLLLRVWIQNKWAWSRAVQARSERTGSKIPVNFLLRKLPSRLSLKPSGPGQSELPCVLEEWLAWWRSHLTFQGGREYPSVPDASRRPAHGSHARSRLLTDSFLQHKESKTFLYVRSRWTSQRLDIVLSFFI